MPEESDPLSNSHCEELRQEYDGDIVSGEDVF
jgi:hypothetical protein